jgi:DNA-binding MarR family transcriptional regulator
MSTTNSRDELISSLLRVSRKVGSQAALWSQAVADRIGLAATDLECLDVLLTEGSSTVGRLAELTGLTTGSATRMVDRLEQAGFVRRVPDPTDRRRVLVEPVAGVGEKLSALHQSFREAQIADYERFDDGQLRVLVDFMAGQGELMRRETEKMRAPSEEAGGGTYTARVGGVTAGKLVFLSGAPRVAIRGDATLRDLYRADFKGPVPKMRVRDGVVTVAYPHTSWFDWRGQFAGQNLDISAHVGQDRGEILLNAAVPWSIEMRGGASTLDGDLRAVRLESVDVKGGVSKLELTLPAPAGIVRIRVAGGLTRMTIRRPAGAAMGLEVAGGVSEITVDGDSYKGSGSLSIQTPGASSVADRFEIEIRGGAAKLQVTTY